jgi:hypothetical protein
MRVSGTPVTFMRDPNDKVTGLISFFYGSEPVTLTKFSDQPPKTAEIPIVPAIVSIAPKAFDECAGEYRLASGTTVTITHDGDRLILRSEGQMTIELHPQAETKFSCPYLPFEATFIKDRTGNVIGVAALSDVADKEFVGQIWRKIRPRAPLVGQPKVVVAVSAGIGLLLLLTSILSRKNSRAMR